MHPIHRPPCFPSLPAVSGVVAASLTKLVLRLASLGVPRAAVHRASAAAMLAIVAMLRLGESAALPTPLDDDSRDRMAACIKVLAAPEPDMVKVSRRGVRLCGYEAGRGFKSLIKWQNGLNIRQLGRGGC
jgi:hypothetical protein